MKNKEQTKLKALRIIENMVAGSIILICVLVIVSLLFYDLLAFWISIGILSPVICLYIRDIKQINANKEV